MKKLIIFSLLLIVSSATFAQLGYPYTKSQTDALFYKKTVADTTFSKIDDIFTPTTFDTLNITAKATAPTKAPGTNTTDVATMAALYVAASDSAKNVSIAKFLGVQNLVLYSEEIGNAYWVKTNAAIVNNDATDLIGDSTLERVTFGSSSNQISSGNITVLPSTNYTLSFDAKRGTATALQYSVRDMTNSAWITAPASYYSSTSATVQRVTVTFATGATCTSARIDLSNDSGVGTVYLGRVQLQKTANPQYYIKTTTAVVQ